MPLPRYRTILVGIDFSPTSRRAFEHAAALARDLGARLEVVHVVHGFKPTLPFSAANRRVVAGVQKEAEAQARAELARWVGRLRGLRVRATALRGLPHEAIVARARRVQADLIVVGERGQNLAESLLLGSTAERVARKATCPVLLVPRPGRRG